MDAPASRSRGVPDGPADDSRQGQIKVPGAWLDFARYLALLAIVAVALGYAWFQELREPTAGGSLFAWDMFSRPIEINAAARLPFIEGHLRDVHVSRDGKLVWIVGDNGLILHSSDMGETWVRQELPSDDLKKLRAVEESLPPPVPEAPPPNPGSIDETPPAPRPSGSPKLAPAAEPAPAPANEAAPPPKAAASLDIGPTLGEQRQVAIGPSWRPGTLSLVTAVFGAAQESKGIPDSIRKGEQPDGEVVSPKQQPPEPKTNDPLQPTKQPYEQSRGISPEPEPDPDLPTIGRPRPQPIGSSWHRPPADKPTLFRATFLADGKTGWVFGHENLVARSLDGGKSWIVRSIVSENAPEDRDLDRRQAIVIDARVRASEKPDGPVTLLAVVPKSQSASEALVVKHEDGKIDSSKPWALRSTSESEKSPKISPVLLVHGDTPIEFVSSAGQFVAVEKTDRAIPHIAGSQGELIEVIRVPRAICATMSGSVWAVTEITPPKNALPIPGQPRRFAIYSLNAPEPAPQSQATAWTREWLSIETALDRVFAFEGKSKDAAGSKYCVWVTDGTGRLFRRPEAPTQDQAEGRAGWDEVPVPLPVGLTADKLEKPAPGSPPPKSAILAMAFAQDQLEYGWLVGTDGRLARTTDGGMTWYSRSRIVPDSQIGRAWWLPAPWLWVSLATLLWVGVDAARRRDQARDRQVVPAGQDRNSDVDPRGLDSDKPVEGVANDRLSFGPVALGLSSFLQNGDTHPPITIAVTGAWGSGKSSLMNMIRYDLSAHRFPTVWFNAWHHERETSLLAALLQNLQIQISPQWWTLPGALFYLQLVRHRLAKSARGFMPIALLGLVIASISLGYLVNNPPLPAARPAATDAKPTGADGAPPKSTTEPADDGWQKYFLQALSIVGLGGVVPLARRIWSAAQLIGIDPTKLLSQSSGNAKGSDLTAQMSLRYRFSQQFGSLTEVLEQLGKRIVIFIDDLDRCQPPQVLEILESINFLVSSGNCFVIMGIEPRWVRLCVAHQFRDVLGGLDLPVPTPAAPAAAGPAGKSDVHPLTSLSKEGPQAERNEVLLERADHYLEKLVNIVVPVPTATADQLQDLMGKPATSPSTGNADESGAAASGIRAYFNGRIGRLLRRVGAVAAIVAVCLLGFQFGAVRSRALAPASQPPPTARTPGSRLQEGSRASASSRTAAADSGDAAGPEIALPAPPAVKQNFDVGSSVRWQWIAWTLPALSVAAVAAFLLVPFRRSKLFLVNDSPEFRTSLKSWYELLATRRSTPRAIKRFVNRLRYYSMRLRRSKGDGETRVPDSQLVALCVIEDALWPNERPAGALQAFASEFLNSRIAWDRDLPDAQKQAMRRILETDDAEFEQACGTLKALGQCLAKHHEAHHSWPPEPAAVKRVEAIMGDIPLA